MKAKLIYIIILLFIPFEIFSKDISNYNLKNSIGLKFSNISGYGFYYNRKVSENVRLQAMGLIYYYYNEEEGDLHINYNYDIGIEIQYELYKSENSRFYILAGGFYYFDDDLKEKSSNKILEINHSYNTGVGIAWEYFYKRFIFGIDLGYKFFEDRIEITENDAPPYPELYRVTKIGAGISVGFVF
ncbi:hypothetical protein ACFLSQ_00220 [Bacteroidota bacterium]